MRPLNLRPDVACDGAGYGDRLREEDPYKPPGMAGVDITSLHRSRSEFA